MKARQNQAEISNVPRRHGSTTDEITLVGSAALPAYTAVSVGPTSGRAQLPSADAVGLSLNRAQIGERVRVALEGSFVEFVGWNWTPGPVNYVADTGALTQGPGVPFGVAITPTRLLILRTGPLPTYVALGLGTMSLQDASSVAITGGSITGITDLAVADGGTGASTAGGARTNLGLGTAAVEDIGTSGATVPLLSSTVTWSGNHTFNATGASIANAMRWRRSSNDSESLALYINDSGPVISAFNDETTLSLDFTLDALDTADGGDGSGANTTTFTLYGSILTPQIKANGVPLWSAGTFWSTNAYSLSGASFGPRNDLDTGLSFPAGNTWSLHAGATEGLRGTTSQVTVGLHLKTQSNLTVGTNTGTTRNLNLTSASGQAASFNFQNTDLNRWAVQNTSADDLIVRAHNDDGTIRDIVATFKRGVGEAITLGRPLDLNAHSISGVTTLTMTGAFLLEDSGALDFNLRSLTNTNVGITVEDASTAWTFGLDNGDSNAFVISSGTALGTNNVLRLLPSFARLTTTAATTLSGVSSIASSPTAGARIVLGNDDGAAMASGDCTAAVLLGGASNSSGATRFPAWIAAYATEDWIEGSANGSKIQFEVTPNGSTSRATAVTIERTALTLASGVQLDAGANKITNLAAGTASTDAARFDQLPTAGTYTPSVTLVTNLAAVSASVFTWCRIGSVVNVTGRVAADPTAIGNILFYMTLPFPSNFTALSELAGVAAGQDQTECFIVRADVTNDAAEVRGAAVTASNHAVSIMFQYTIV